MAERLAVLPPDRRAALVADPEALATHLGLTVSELQGVVSDERFWLRPAQLEALSDPSPIVLLMGGRGCGKNRTASNWVINHARSPGTRIHLVARTVADVRDTVVQGESGIIATSPPGFVPEYLPSLRKLIWPNGSLALTFSSAEPAQLRGPQSHATYCDELGAWPQLVDEAGASAWDHVRLSTRLGPNPQILVTTTPRRTPILKGLLTQVAEEDARERITATGGGSVAG